MKLAVLEKNSVGEEMDFSCFEEFGEVTYYANTLRETVAEHVRDADIVIVNKAPINEETLKDCPNVKFISILATGYDNVDLDYCRSRGIVVSNVVNYSTAAVAQHTFALLFYLLEHLNYYDSYVKSGDYAGQDRFSNFDRAFSEIAGKTWGIIGLGTIGKTVAKIAEAFGCHVIFYSASGFSTCMDYKRVELEELLTGSDIISIHAPLSDRTRNLIDLKAFEKMKSSAILINVARGPIVNEQDLATALKEGMIAAAGLDVLGREPIAVDSPLADIKDSDRLIITPHLAWASTEARVRLIQEVYLNICAFLQGNGRNVVS